MSIQLATVDPTELDQLVVEAWRQTAPKRLVAAYDADQDAQEAGSDAPGSGADRPGAGAGVTRGRGSMRAWRLDLARFR